MKTKTRWWGVLCLALLWLGSGNIRATTFLQFQSTWLGDGWFQYKMSVLNDPFFTKVNVGVGIKFTNQIDHILTTTNATYTNDDSTFITWSPDEDYPPRPYERTFLVRSAESAYKLGTNFDGAIALMLLYPSELMQPGFSENMFGYCVMPCLVPCPPDQADNSPTNFDYTLRLLPDIKITQLIQTNDQTFGLSFDWDHESTFVLQGSTDLINWTNISYIWSTPPETIWTTNQPLNDFGNFFQVTLVAAEYTTNVPPLNSSPLRSKTSITARQTRQPLPRVTRCHPKNGNIEVSLALSPNQPCEVRAKDSHGITRQTQKIKSPQNSATVRFTTSDLPNPVFFDAVAAP